MTLLAEIAVLTVAAVAVAVCLAVIPRTGRWRIARATAPEPSPPEQLVRLERLIGTSQTSASHTHAYLRPLLAELVVSRLAARGQSFEQMPADSSRQLLGDELWELVRPDRPFPEDRWSAGVSAANLTSMLDVLERL